MVSNVLTPNNNTQALVDLVQQKRPDVLITLESDQKWQDALTVIEPDYPYTVKVPLDNLYGMHLYSKFELIDPEIKYLLIDDIFTSGATVDAAAGCLRDAGAKYIDIAIIARQR